jgi:hypothetical protein
MEDGIERMMAPEAYNIHFLKPEKPKKIEKPEKIEKNICDNSKVLIIKETTSTNLQ